MTEWEWEGMGIAHTRIPWEWECQKIGNGDGREWELNRWEWEGIGMLKAIPAHLYSEDTFILDFGGNQNHVAL